MAFFKNTTNYSTTTAPKITFQGKELKVGDTWSYGGKSYEMTPQGSRVVQPQAGVYANQAQPPQAAAVANQSLASLYGDTMNELRAAQQRQYEATQKRDQELRQGYQQRLDKSMQMLEGMGAQERADIESSWAGKESQAKQDMLSRGLMGTTVSPTVLAGYQRGAKEDVGRLEERLRNQRLGVYGQLTADQLGQIERVSDIPPDTGRYMQLMQQLGQAQAMAEPQGSYADPVSQKSKSYTTTSYSPGYLRWKQELADKEASKKSAPKAKKSVPKGQVVGLSRKYGSKGTNNPTAKTTTNNSTDEKKYVTIRKGVEQGYMVGKQGMAGTPPKSTGYNDLDQFYQQQYANAVMQNLYNPYAKLFPLSPYRA